jgi:hypothetical protein
MKVFIVLDDDGGLVDLFQTLASAEKCKSEYVYDFGDKFYIDERTVNE